MLRFVHFPDSGGKSYSACISKELLSVLWEFLWIEVSNCVHTDVVVYLLMTKPGHYLQGKQAHKSSLPLFGTPFRNLPLENPYGGVMIGFKLLDNIVPIISARSDADDAKESEEEMEELAIAMPRRPLKLGGEASELESLELQMHRMEFFVMDGFLVSRQR
ncbi:hypothetical protein NC652_037187 [Populus alba x Populus x berolinensis]|nr:hypothetical protein NC652_037187 [Populus alba x Populus x berolinensis]